MERSSSVSMTSEESIDRIQDLECENGALRSLIDDLRWRVADICMIGTACFCMGFLCHDGFICVYKWLCSLWFYLGVHHG